MDYIHGDIDIRKVDSIPKGAKVIGRVFAEGETTGHEHRIQGNGQVLELDGTRYLQIEGKAQLVHEEHKPITIEPGFYKLENEKDYNWFTEEIQKVRD